VNITIKLFAHLATYLPAGAARNVGSLTLSDGTTVGDVIDLLKIPPRQCHIVLLDGVYVPPEDRPSKRLSEGQALAIWPLVAGG